MVQIILNFNIYDCFTTKDMIFSGAFGKFILIERLNSQTFFEEKHGKKSRLRWKYKTHFVTARKISLEIDTINLFSHLLELLFVFFPVALCLC